MNSPTQSERYESLDGLRGWLCMSVICYHAVLGMVTLRATSVITRGIFQHTGYDVYGRTAIALLAGETAVFLFFALSGVVLLSSLERDARQLGLMRAILIFPLKRVLRLLPVFVVCLIMMYLAFNALHFLIPSIYLYRPTSELLVNLRLEHFPINGATWTIRAELLAVPLIILALLLRRKFGLHGLLALFAIALVLYEKKWFPQSFEMLNRASVFFMAGFIAFDLAQLLKPGTISNATVWFSLFFVMLFKPMVGESRMAIGVQACAMVVLLLGLMNQSESTLARWLRTRAIVFVGKISYSLCLCNVFFLVLFLRPFLATFGKTQTYYVELGMTLGVIVILLSIPVSVMLNRWVELPIARWSKVLTTTLLEMTVMSRPFRSRRRTEPKVMGTLPPITAKI